MEDNSTRKAYKYCIVPECKSTSVKTPNKIFITNPRDPKRSKDWQVAMQRNVMLSVKSRFFVCEDHFNLATDMENYVKFKLMDNVPIRMRPDVVPHIFGCQKNSIGTQSLKKQRQIIVQDSVEALQQSSTSKISSNNSGGQRIHFESNAEKSDDCAEMVVIQINKKIQASIKPRMSSRSTQCDLENI